MTRKLAKGRFETALRGFAVDERHLSGAHPMEAIAATARDERIAVVVMGAISRRWLRGPGHWQYRRTRPGRAKL